MVINRSGPLSTALKIRANFLRRKKTGVARCHVEVLAKQTCNTYVDALVIASTTKDRCYDFLNIFAENFRENIGVFCSNYCKFLQKL
jgi:hypothetical protein